MWTKIRKFFSENHKSIYIVSGIIAFVFGVLPFILKLIDPSTALLDLSVLNLIFTGFIILGLSLLTVWGVIVAAFRRTLDRFLDTVDISDRFMALPDEKKFEYLFKTLWVILGVAVIAFKPIIFLISK